MNKETLIEKLNSNGEFYLAGFLEKSEFSIYDIFANGIINCLKNVKFYGYEDTYLFPLKFRLFFPFSGKILNYEYSYPVVFSKDTLENANYLTDDEKAFIYSFIKSLEYPEGKIDPKFNIAGLGYTHFVPNYEYFIKNSFVDFEKMVNDSNKKHQNNLTKNLVLIVKEIKELILKIVNYLESCSTKRSIKLADAYKKILTAPAKNIYEALVRINFIFHLDNCDNLGKLDTYISKFEIEENTKSVIEEIYDSMEYLKAWNCFISEDNEHSKLCIEASYGKPKPNLSIAVKDGFKNFEQIINLLNVNGCAALYNFNSYYKGLVELGVQENDASYFAFGGCSELNIAGKCKTGSLDGGLNLVEILYDTIMGYGDFNTYEDLVKIYKENIKENLNELVKGINECYELRKIYRPQLIRSLLCEGPLEKGLDFNAGGAKYNFSIINMGSFANAVDSLSNFKKVVFEKKLITYDKVRDCIKNNKIEILENLPLKENGFGNDCEETDKIAAVLFDFLINEINSRKLTVCNNAKFLMSCIMFDTCACIGKVTHCSFDGRRNGDVIADSGGAATGKDLTSPTALLKSVSKLNPSRAMGTWITNLKLSKELLKSENQKVSLRTLIEYYFSHGGNQIQINCVNKDVLIRALDDKVLAESIIVRVSGYSARFSSLTRDLQENIIKRTCY